MIKHQSRPTSKIKINSKPSITTTTMDNRETTNIEKIKEDQLRLLLGKRKNVSLGGKTQVKRFTESVPIDFYRSKQPFRT